MANSKKKKKKAKWIAIGAALVVVAIVVATCNNSSEETKVVYYKEAVKGNVSSVLDSSGTIASENTRIYTSPVTAEITAVNVKAGQQVKKGDYLVTYDTTSLEKTYTQAELQAKSSGATDADAIAKSDECAAEAKRQQENIDTLNSQIDTVKQEIENIRTAMSEAGDDEASLESMQKSLDDKSAYLSLLQENLATAQAKKETAEAGILSENARASLTYNSQAANIGVDNAQEDLDKAKAGVVAEFDGIVTSVDVSAGSTATEGLAMISVADTSAMKIDMQVSKYNLEELAVGQSAAITSLEHEYQGSVSSISKMAIVQPSENAASGGSSNMVEAEVHIDNPDDKLVIGMDAKVKVTLGNAQDVIIVPVSAVNTDKDGDFVYIVEDGKIKRQKVTTGLYGTEDVEITEGIEAGAHVITVIDSSIEDGMQADEVPAED